MASFGEHPTESRGAAAPLYAHSCFSRTSRRLTKNRFALFSGAPSSLSLSSLEENLSQLAHVCHFALLSLPACADLSHRMSSIPPVFTLHSRFCLLSHRVLVVRTLGAPRSARLRPSFLFGEMIAPSSATTSKGHRSLVLLSADDCRSKELGLNLSIAEKCSKQSITQMYTRKRRLRTLLAKLLASGTQQTALLLFL